MGLIKGAIGGKDEEGRVNEGMNGVIEGEDEGG
jgi:hypothetical protein